MIRADDYVPVPWLPSVGLLEAERDWMAWQVTRDVAYGYPNKRRARVALAIADAIDTAWRTYLTDLRSKGTT